MTIYPFPARLLIVANALRFSYPKTISILQGLLPDTIN